jgi:cysteine desulfurase/selenocysteine lyase
MHKTDVDFVTVFFMLCIVIRLHPNILAFPGHKGLLGLQGTGGLYVRENVPIRPLVQGGTGSFSDSLTQPDIFPDVLESGTLNVPGIAGLGKAVQYIIDTGIRETDLLI